MSKAKELLEKFSMDEANMNHKALVTPIEKVLDAILELRKAMGKEYRGWSSSGQVPAYLKTDDAYLDGVSEKLAKWVKAYSRGMAVTE